MVVRYVLVLGVVVALAAVIWLVADHGPREAAVAKTTRSAPADAGTVANATLGSIGSARDERTAAVDSARPPEVATQRVLVVVVDADSARNLADIAIVSLTNAQGLSRGPQIDYASGSIEFGGLLRGTYTLNVTARDYNPEERKLVVGEDGDEPRIERVELAPLPRIVLRARTPDGKPFRELASRIGGTPSELFDHAFTVSTRNSDLDPSRAVYLPSAVAEGSAAERDDMVGVLEDPDPSGTWVELFFRGRSIERKFAPPRTRELVFTFGLDFLRGALAELTLRVVDARTREPLSGAVARLEAHDIATRSSVAGAFEFDAQVRATAHALAAGDYTLVVSAPGHAEYRAQVKIAVGARDDLGDIALELARPFHVRVVDRAGHPLAARVFVGPFAAGKSIDALLSEHFETTDASGVATLPAPMTTSIVRASLIDGASVALLPETKSRVALIEPNNLPAMLELVVWEPTLVEIVRSEAPNVASLALETDFGLELGASRSAALLTYAQPAGYVAIARDVNDVVLARRPFEVVEGERVSITLP